MFTKKRKMEFQFDENLNGMRLTAIVDKVCWLKRLFIQGNLHGSDRSGFEVWYTFRWDEIILTTQTNWIVWLNVLMSTYFHEKKTISPIAK